MLPLSRRAEKRRRGAGRLGQAREQRVGELLLAVILAEGGGEQAVQLLVEELRETLGFCLQVTLQLQASLWDRKRTRRRLDDWEIHSAFAIHLNDIIVNIIVIANISAFSTQRK